MRIRVAALIVVALFVTTTASAQPAPNVAHNQSIAGGVQWALPYSGHGEPPGGLASWRYLFSPRVGIGTEFRWFTRHSTSELPMPSAPDPRGSTIALVHAIDDRWINSYGVGIDVLAQDSIGRLSLVGGIGPGFFVERTRYARRIDDTHQSGSSTISSIGLHAFVELDVRATSRLSVFAGLRIEVRDLGTFDSSFGYPAAGVRFAF
jgi:hypothetical protein